MKKIMALLVAATFAGVSFQALADDAAKKDGKSADATKSHKASAKDKKDGKTHDMKHDAKKGEEKK